MLTYGNGIRAERLTTHNEDFRQTVSRSKFKPRTSQIPVWSFITTPACLVINGKFSLVAFVVVECTVPYESLVLHYHCLDQQWTTLGP
jgi:hypothetical protein